jgi:hypothetical protein
LASRLGLLSGLTSLLYAAINVATSEDMKHFYGKKQSGRDKSCKIFCGRLWMEKGCSA